MVSKVDILGELILHSNRELDSVIKMNFSEFYVDEIFSIWLFFTWDIDSF